MDEEILLRTCFEQAEISRKYRARLLKIFSSPVAIMKASYASLRRVGLNDEESRRIRDFRREPVEDSLLPLLEQGIHVTWPGKPDYPPLLQEIGAPPRLLFVRGDLDSTVPGVAVVGSRKASPYGLEQAGRLSRELARRGYAVVSGAAVGIDAAAHRAAMEASGTTWAVLGCGLDIPYPRRHKTLFDEIARCGAVVSEFPPGTPPRAEHFPRRNRIISGLSRAVVVVEGRLRSGSLITARLAGDQGRAVLAVPHDLDAPGGGGEGPNRLISKDGVRLLRSVEDILEELPPELRLPMGGGALPLAVEPRMAGDPPASLQVLYEHLIRRRTPTPDELAQKVGWSVQKVLSELAVLELEGLVEKLPGLRYRLKDDRKEGSYGQHEKPGDR